MKNNLIALVLGLTSTSLFAQNEFKHSVNVRPIPFKNLTIAANYEYLFAPKFGVVVDTKIRMPFAEITGYNAGISLRNHTKGEMGGFFWGVFANYSLLGMVSEVTVDDETTEYPFEIKSFKAGLNLGKRWMVSDSGINIVVRGGYGYPIYYDFGWTDLGEPEYVPDEVDRLINGIGKVISGIDLEISIGYSF